MRTTPIVAVAFLVILSACSDKQAADGTSTPQAADSASDAQPTERGDVAVWAVAPGSEVITESTEFTAVVTRLGCSGGVTGRVLAPRTETTVTHVIITFEAESLAPGNYNCLGNDAVPYSVVLDEPIGDRELVDGQCATGRPAATTAFCGDTSIRWPVRAVAP